MAPRIQPNSAFVTAPLLPMATAERQVMDFARDKTKPSFQSNNASNFLHSDHAHFLCPVHATCPQLSPRTALLITDEWTPHLRQISD